MSETTPVPGTLSRGLVVLFGLAAAAIVVTGLRSAAGLVGPVFFALVLTIAVHPARRWLHRLHVPGWAASLLCVITVYLLLVGLTLALVAATTRFAELLPDYQAQFKDLLHDVTTWLAGLGVGQDELHQLEQAISPGKIATLVAAILGSLLSVVSNLFFVLTLVLFMTMDATSFPDHLARAGVARGPLVEALIGFAVGTRSYLVVSAVFGLIVAVIDSSALALLGIPVRAVGPARVHHELHPEHRLRDRAGAARRGRPARGRSRAGLAVVVVYCVVNLVIQSVIQPKFIGDTVGLSTS